jgi:hypothetical protein
MTFNQKVKDSAPFILLVSVLFLAISLLDFKCQRAKSDKSDVKLVQALADSLVFYKRADSTGKASIAVIQMDRAKDFIELQIKDREIQELQKTVKEYKGKLKAGSSVTNALIETVAELRNRPTTIFKAGDTTIIDSIAYVYPTYTSSIENEWITLKDTISRDTAIHYLKVKNKFSVIVGYDKKKPFVDLITQNPYTETKSLRTYQVSLPKQKRWGIGLSAGVTATFNNLQVRPAPYVGVGINYNLIRF